MIQVSKKSFNDCIILSNNERNPDFEKECRYLKVGIFEKLDIKNDVELTKLSIKHGLMASEVAA